MRDIRFRVWNNRTGQMKIVDSINFGHKLVYSGGSASGNAYWTSPSHNQMSHIELLQYTGLKDLHGKDVYEGDILRYAYRKAPVNDRVVKWNAGGFNVRKTDSYEVVGNMYQNKELMP